MAKNTGRFWVPRSTVDDSLPPLGLEVKTLLVLARFANREGICWPSIKTISECTGSSERSVRKHLRLLVNHELITIVDGKRGGRGKPTKYRLKDKGEERAA
jgi:DNA-binding IscR family transcriptional regulator